MVVQAVAPATTPSPASAPQLRDASPKLPVSSTLPSVPMARWPGYWLAFSGSTITSWVSAPVLWTRRDTSPAGMVDGTTKMRIIPMPGHGKPFCHGDIQLLGAPGSYGLDPIIPDPILPGPIIPPMSVRVTSTIEPVSVGVAHDAGD